MVWAHKEKSRVWGNVKGVLLEFVIMTRHISILPEGEKSRGKG
jgi:hypothetical protein